MAKDQLNCDHCRLFAIPVSLLCFEYLFEPIKEEVIEEEETATDISPVSNSNVSEEELVNRFLV